MEISKNLQKGLKNPKLLGLDDQKFESGPGPMEAYQLIRIQFRRSQINSVDRTKSRD